MRDRPTSDLVVAHRCRRWVPTVMKRRLRLTAALSVAVTPVARAQDTAGVRALEARAPVRPAAADTATGARRVARKVARKGARKHPALGGALSLVVPGAGQLYAGRRVKGAALFLGVYGGVSLGAASHECNGTPGRGCDDQVLAAGLGVALGTWLYAIASAPGDVRRWNTRHDALAGGPRLIPHLAPGVGGTQFGLAAAW